MSTPNYRIARLRGVLPPLPPDPLPENGLTNLPPFSCAGPAPRAETNLSFERGRHYDPAMDRWLCLEPLAFDAATGDCYRFVGNGQGEETGDALLESSDERGEPFTWTGRELDEQTELQYLRARCHDPRVRVWLGTDGPRAACEQADR